MDKKLGDLVWSTRTALGVFIDPMCYGSKVKIFPKDLAKSGNYEDVLVKDFAENFSAEDLLKFKNIGKKTVSEIRRQIENLGYHLKGEEVKNSRSSFKNWFAYYVYKKGYGVDYANEIREAAFAAWKAAKDI